MKINFYKTVIRSILFGLPAEKAHHLTFALIKVFSPFLSLFFRPHQRTIAGVDLIGLHFPNTVGLAAGLDKNGLVYKQMGKLGFGFVEVGTVTPKPQTGNPLPRLFRLKRDNALINRMGFNNDGVDALAARLVNRPNDLIIGGNIGKNTKTPNDLAHLDYLYCFEKLYSLVDYFVVNVSCPNIADLKDLQDKDNLLKILSTLTHYRVNQEQKIPILLKVSPDLNEDQLDDLISVVLETGIDGLIATNTTITRKNLRAPEEEITRIGKGGLSGEPLKQRSLEVIRYLRRNLPEGFPIIASGCVHKADDARKAMDAGAQLVQIYTGFIYEGPGLIRSIIRS